MKAMLNENVKGKISWEQFFLQRHPDVVECDLHQKPTSDGKETRKWLSSGAGQLLIRELGKVVITEILENREAATSTLNFPYTKRKWTKGN